MDSSRGFGSHPRYARLLQTRFPSGCPALALVNPATTMHSPDHSTKGTPSACPPPRGERPLTAGEYAVSGTLSSPSRGAFHLSLTVLVPYRSLKVFSLGGWSPRIPTNSPGFVVLRCRRLPHACSPTGLSPSLVVPSSTFGSDSWLARVGPTTPACTRQTGLGSSRFARHYSGNLG